MESKVNAICIKAIDYKDNDKLLTLVSPERGKFLTRIRGVRAQKAKLKLAASPLCFGEYIIVKKGKTSLITGCNIVDSFFNCWQDEKKTLAAFSVLEILDKFLIEDQNAQTEFILALKALQVINYNDFFVYSAVACFLSKIIHQQGIDINEFKIEKEIQDMLSALCCVPFEELEGFDAEILDIKKCIKTLQTIIIHSLSFELKTLNQILKDI